jgi:hypothetical protein
MSGDSFLEQLIKEPTKFIVSVHQFECENPNDLVTFNELNRFCKRNKSRQFQSTIWNTVVNQMQEIGIISHFLIENKKQFMLTSKGHQMAESILKMKKIMEVAYGRRGR